MAVDGLVRVVTALAAAMLLLGGPLAGESLALLGTCSNIFDNGTWVIATCQTDDETTLAPMAVTLGGVSKGTALGVQVYHVASPGHYPQVAVFTSDGFLRLKPLDLIASPIAFGTSAILGPNYWPAGATAGTHNPDIDTFAIDVAQVGQSPSALRFHLTGTVGSLQVTYDLRLITPTTFETRLHVDQMALAPSAISFDAGHVALHEGYKEAAHFSSMFVTDVAPCVGVMFTHCHDADAVRFLGHDGTAHRRDFKDVTQPSFVFPAPHRRLGDHILDVLETHSLTWENVRRPSLRLLLDTPPGDFTAQGRVGAQTDPRSGDNVDVWIQDGNRAASGFQAGDTARIGYTLIAGAAMHPSIVQGFTWFSDGQFAKSGPKGTVVTAFGTSLIPNRSYQLVSGRADDQGAPCALDVVPVNPSVRRASSSGLIGNTAGRVTRPPGACSICWYEVEPGVRGRSAGVPLQFTVLTGGYHPRQTKSEVTAAIGFGPHGTAHA